MSLVRANSLHPQFSGWGACPIKTLSMEPWDTEVVNQIQTIADREGIEVRYQTNNGTFDRASDIGVQEKVPSRLAGAFSSFGHWGQDDKQFVWDGRTESILNSGNQEAVSNVAKNLGLQETGINSGIKFGDVYLMKFPDGKLYGLMGKNSLSAYTQAEHDISLAVFSSDDFQEEKLPKLNEESRQELKELFHVQELFVISSPTDHLDKSIRPLKGNKLLLADYQLSIDLINEALKVSDDETEKEKLQELLSGTAYWKRQYRSGEYNLQLAEEQLDDTFDIEKIPGLFGAYPDGSQAQWVNYS